MLNRIRQEHYEGNLLKARSLAEKQSDNGDICFEYALICIDLHLAIDAEKVMTRFSGNKKKLIEIGILIERHQFDQAKDILDQLKVMNYELMVKNLLLLSLLELINAPYQEIVDVLEQLQKGKYNPSMYLFQKIDYLLKDHQYEVAKKQLRKAALKYPNHPKVNELRNQMKSRSQKYSKTKSTEIQVEEHPMETLEKFIGLEPIKETVKGLVKTIEFNKQRKVMLNIEDESSTGFHFIFKGNPGTGKTTIARILGGIFKHHELLEKGHVIEVDRSGLVGEYIGQTESKTKEAIDKAMGGILFVDEAYALYREGSQNDFGKEAIDTLLKAMEDHRDDLCIIFAGYNDEMSEFLNSNPGLRSRVNFHLDFPDYSDDELLRIADEMVKEKHYKIHDNSRAVLLEQLEIEKVDDTFGNARVVRNLLDEAIRTKATRLAGTDFTKEEAEFLTPEDFGMTSFKSKETVMDEAVESLDHLIGLTELKNQILDMKDFAAYQLKRKSLNLSIKDISYHMTFEGNPGTGKTTVARIVAQIFKSLGILKRGHLIEATREDLVASYIGQTAEKTSKLIKKAYGGVLFIDEAYALASDGPNDFGKEAIDTLIKHMEDDRDRVVIILAGYTDNMQQLLNKNPGFESRINYRLKFEDYSEEDLNNILDMYIHLDGYDLTKEARVAKDRTIKTLSDQRGDNFGNARSVRNIFEKVKVNQGTRFNREKLPDDQITLIDVQDFGGV